MGWGGGCDKNQRLVMVNSKGIYHVKYSGCIMLYNHQDNIAYKVSIFITSPALGLNNVT